MLDGATFTFYDCCGHLAAKISNSAFVFRFSGSESKNGRNKNEEDDKNEKKVEDGRNETNEKSEKKVNGERGVE